MTAKADSYVAELSDGERQKAMIAKTLAQQCPVILLDEPTAFLDVASRIEIMELLHRLARLQRKTVLLSTHDVEQALRLSDRIWLLSRAEGFCCGTPEDLALSGPDGSLFRARRSVFRSAGRGIARQAGRCSRRAVRSCGRGFGPLDEECAGTQRISSDIGRPGRIASARAGFGARSHRVVPARFSFSDLPFLRRMGRRRPLRRSGAFRSRIVPDATIRGFHRCRLYLYSWRKAAVLLSAHRPVALCAGYPCAYFEHAFQCRKEHAPFRLGRFSSLLRKVCMFGLPRCGTRIDELLT